MNTTKADPLLFNQQQMEKITAPFVVEQGKQLYMNGNVHNFTAKNNSIQAHVIENDFHYDLQISSPDGDSLFIDCECENIDFPICPHVISALFHYKDNCSSSPNMKDPIQQSICHDHAIDLLSEVLQPDLLRVLEVGKGLVCVMQELQPFYYEAIAAIGKPIILLDEITLFGLQSIEADFPVSGVKLLYDVSAQSQQADKIYLFQLAQDHLDVASTKLADRQLDDIVDNVLAALMAAMAAYAGMKSPPEIESVAVWIINEAVPNNWLNDDQAALIMQLLALSKAETLPLNIIQKMHQDVYDFVRNLAHE